MFSQVSQDSRSYTAVLDPPGSGGTFYSQVTHTPGDRSAHFSFLAPGIIKEGDDLCSLIDFLTFQAGEMGALNVIADIEESHYLFEVLRRSGFSVFCWESIWQLPVEDQPVDSPTNWKVPAAADLNTVRCLFQTLVPPLVQHAEPFNNGTPPRLVYRTNGDIQAYVEAYSGREGTYLVPVIHPSVENIEVLLADLINQFQGHHQPVYLQVRSYQAWLSDALQDTRAEPSPRFALMVKHLAVSQRSAVLAGQRAHADHRQAEPTAPIVNNYARSSAGSEGME